MKYLFIALAFITFSCSNTSETNENNTSDQDEVVKGEVLANSNVKLAIDGMTCEIGCVRTVKSHLSKMNGVTDINIDFDTSRTTDFSIVRFDSNFVSEKELIAEIESIANGLYGVTGTEKMPD